MFGETNLHNLMASGDRVWIAWHGHVMQTLRDMGDDGKLQALHTISGGTYLAIDIPDYMTRLAGSDE